VWKQHRVWAEQRPERSVRRSECLPPCSRWKQAGTTPRLMFTATVGDGAEVEMEVAL
jgi:hypothetical protein